MTNLGGAIGIMFQHAINGRVIINNCDIKGNTAFVNNASFVNTHATNNKRILSNYYTLGGGLSIIHTHGAHHNIVKVTNCNIEKNMATYAGGIFVTFVHNATENSVYMRNLTIKDNFASQTGGGFICSSWERSHNNSFDLHESIVTDNEAMTGGGAKLILNNRNPFRPEEAAGIIRIKIAKTHFVRNYAKSASAIRLLFNLPNIMAPPIIPVLEDCNISYNKPVEGSKSYLGAIISTRLSFALIGRNISMRNTAGSVVYISNAEVHMMGNTFFYYNQGKYGGAMYIADRSKLILHPSSLLHFEGNQADIHGGALNVESSNYVETMYPYNPGCFLQYSEPKTPPSNWTVSVCVYI